MPGQESTSPKWSGSKKSESQLKQGERASERFHSTLSAGSFTEERQRETERERQSQRETERQRQRVRDRGRRQKQSPRGKATEV